MAVSALHSGDAEVLFCAREDVNVEQLGDKFIVQDPIRNSFVQLGVAEYIVFRCFDGASSVQDICERLKRERDITATPANIMRLRDRLHEKQVVLKPGEIVVAASPEVAGEARGIGRLVMIDLGLSFNPDVWLTRLFHRIKHVVFRPAFFVGLAVVVMLAAMVWLRSWDEIRNQTGGLRAGGGALLLYYACLSASIFAHETAHGVATKGFGGRVPKMGTFLYFFLFVFYTDVSASYLFPSKFRKLMVLFAGALANLGICAISTLVWRVTDVGSFVNQVCFALMMINALAASFTLFPLLRGDGYYILSTALDLPNLRENAYRYARAVVRKIVADRDTELPKATDRAGLIYLVYAPLQTLFFIGFFGYVALRTSTWLIGELHFWGFWLIVLVLCDRLVRPALHRGTLGWLARMWRLELAIGVVIAIAAIVPYHLHVSARFEVISAAPAVVRAKTAGIVAHYLVTTGAEVTAGQVVAEMLDTELAQERATAAASLDEARSKLAQLQAGYRKEEVAGATSSQAASHAATELAAVELRRTRNLYLQQMESKKNLEAAEADYRTALAREHASQSELSRMHHGYREEEIARERAVVAQREKDLAAIDQRLEWTKIRALVAGRVVTRVPDLEHRVGTHVEVGDPVIEIVSQNQLSARLEVPEEYVQDVAVGMPVELRFFDAPSAPVTSELDGMEMTVSANGAIGMHSHVRVAEPLGATGIAKVDAGSQSILSLCLRRANRAAAVVFWSWW